MKTKVKIVRIVGENGIMSYPVGSYMPLNLPYIKAMIKEIKKRKFSNIVLVARGSSGAIIAGIIASKIEARIHYIRKEEETGHGDTKYCLRDNPTIIVVDDFVSTGRTIKKIIENLVGESIMKAQMLIVSGSRVAPFNFFEEEVYIQ